MSGFDVVFRADASAAIGAGHVMRCLALAGAFRDRKKAVLFICREQAGDFCEHIEGQGFEVCRLPPALHSSWEDDARETTAALAALPVRPACLIVDHYSLDARWERMQRGETASIVVIDDMANRPHECDLLLDQNYYERPGQRYDALVPTSARRLLGPAYALLRPEFVRARMSLGSTDGQRLFVSLGAHDPFDICGKTLQAVRQINAAGLGVEVVAGADPDLRKRLMAVAARLFDVSVHGFVDNVATLMSRCSIAVGAGGVSTWERCALGLPSLVTVVTDNQRQTARDLAEAGIIRLLGEASEVTGDMLAIAIGDLLDDHASRRSMRSKSLALVDCNGVQRVAEEVLKVASCTG